MRQIILDTETTGFEPAQGHRILEIGCVELINRRLTGRHFHRYINPQRESDPGALAVHGITSAFLADKPGFHDIVVELIEFIQGAELIIHNASFDVGFLEHEFRLANLEPAHIQAYCTVLDTLTLARQLHPGQKNSLDALCKRYSIDNSNRELHGALLDSELLARVYLAMTGGQATLFDTLQHQPSIHNTSAELNKVPRARQRPTPLLVIPADSQELAAHQERLNSIQQAADGHCLWLELEPFKSVADNSNGDN